ncbi:MAG: uroporphyrinogen-III synthase [Acidobacteriota bacterium]|nr:uroporphyrinogen-III synthase [Acidobacteriota bacterium]MDQ7086585.1 uroporphyrinogen-III synthase [Acidobacteriota bacterium]
MSDSPSLAGRTVILTRAREDAAGWARRLEELGAHALVLPCIEVEVFHDAQTAARLTAALEGAQWLLLSSPRGVGAVAGLVTSLPATVNVAVVGPATARRAAEWLAAPRLVAPGGSARSLGESLAAHLGEAPATIVTALAQGGRTDAVEILRHRGHVVTTVEVYATRPHPRKDPPDDLRHLDRPLVFLASPSAARGLIQRARLPTSARIITIGPTTTAAARELGLSVTAEATGRSLNDLVAAAARVS